MNKFELLAVVEGAGEQSLLFRRGRLTYKPSPRPQHDFAITQRRWRR